MARRVGPGPVFVYESLIFARRRQEYAGRALFDAVYTAWSALPRRDRSHDETGQGSRS